MMKFLVRASIMAMPVAALVWLVQAVVEPLYRTGEVWTALGYAFGAVVVLAVWEGLAFRAWLLPLFGRGVSAVVYGGGYSAQDDPLAVLAARIRQSRDAALLPEFLEVVQQQRTRARAWTELADIYEQCFNNLPEALRALEQGAELAEPDEDRAMLLCRAARLRRSRLNDAAGADELLRLAAKLYPHTAYGREAGRVGGGNDD